MMKKIILLTAVLAISISLTAQVHTLQELHLHAGGQITAPGRMHINGSEILFLLNKNGVIIGKEWGGSGHLTVEGDVNIGGNNDAELRVRNIKGKSYNNNTYDHLWLQNGTGKDVFIGHINKPSNVTVFGKLGARKVRVTTEGWADYVFKKAYVLPSLEEVAQHIAANGHLKDIPSAATVVKNGIDLGDMDAKLLAKIEELTLYMIDMSKQIKVANKRISALEIENQFLKNNTLKTKQP